MELMDLLKTAVEMKASDVFAVAGAPATAKIHGELKTLNGDKLLPPDTLRLISGTYDLAKRLMDRLMETGDDDFSVTIPGLARFRVNAYRQRGSFAMVIRVVAFDIPVADNIGIPEDIIELANVKAGMVLITGTAGSGKSTTQACILDRINKTRPCHIITLEDPIEYLHRDIKSIVSQREIAIDTADCAAALKACLRQAPDVILVGEMRDPDTISAAMTAAETGHMLMATLHTKGAVNTVDRIIDSFPPSQQQQIRIQLSMVLDTVVSQRLIPSVDGGQIPAFEIMHNTGAIRSLIRDSKTHQIDNAISTGAAQGMISMDGYIYNLYKEGKITQQTAVDYANDAEMMRRKIGR